MECNNDINTMIDLAKVADLVSLTRDDADIPAELLRSDACGWLCAGPDADRRQLWLRNGDVRVPQHLSGTRLPSDHGRSHSPGLLQEQQDSEKDQEEPEASLLDGGVPGDCGVCSAAALRHAGSSVSHLWVWVFREPNSSTCRGWCTGSTRLRR